MVSMVAAAGLALAAQSGTPPPPAGQDPQQPTFRLRIDSVSVDVAVTDRQGNPVTDLTAADFEVREGGKPQTIDNFRLITVDDNRSPDPARVRDILSFSDQQRETASLDNRLFIIFLDDYHVRLGNSMRIRESLARFVSQLSPRDLVAVLYPLTPVTAATFSRNHDGTAQAIMKFRGRKYDYTPQNPYEERYAIQPPEALERMRNEITIASLESVCAYLATLREGRKTVLFVSEGLSGTLPGGVNTTGSLFKPNPASGSSQSAAFFNSVELMSRFREVFTAASRSNTSVYTLDPRGLATSEFDAADRVGFDADKMVLNEAMDSLRVLADQTDGRAIVNRNDPVPELQRMVRDLSAYYLLGYNSTVAPRDGKFHEIQVRVTRRDVQVRARKGYWAYSAEEVERATAPAKAGPPADVAAAIEDLVGIAEGAGRRPVTVWMGAARGPAEKAVVTFAWEPSPQVGRDPIDLVEQVSITAHAITGDLLFRGPVPRDTQSIRPGGRATFEAPPGAVRVRVTPENAKGQRLEAVDETYVVPDFTGPAPAISAPMVFRGRTARDIQQLRVATAALPAASRTFSRTERLLIRFDAYGPGGTTPAVSLRLLNRLGESMSALPAPTATTGGTFEAELGLGALPPGDYLIEITAKGGEESARTLLAIRVTG